MKIYYVCCPYETDNIRRFRDETYAYTDNIFLMSQYIRHSHPPLQQYIGDYDVVVEEYVVEDEEQLFCAVEEEHGYLMSDYNEIYSLESANDPEVMIYCTDYMSTYVFNAAECCGESEVDIFLRYAYMSTSAFNIISNSGILKMPKEVQLMMSLLDGKYIPLLIALGYTDIGSWANTELIDVVKESLPDQYNHLMIFDVLDEVMVLVKLYITDDISF